MLIIIILLVVALGVIAGYAVRQRQTLRENADTIQEQAAENERLVRENESLGRDKRDHETNLEMVLDELGKS